jgi:hypothetical protein
MSFAIGPVELLMLVLALAAFASAVAVTVFLLVRRGGRTPDEQPGGTAG